MRKLVIALLVLAALCGVGLFFAGSLVRAAVEKGGKYALGVDTKLDGASLSPLAGRVGLSGLQIANPAGFKGPYFLRLDSAQLHVATASLMKDVVEVPSFELDGFDVYLERANGHTNYGELLDALKRLETSGGQTSKPTDATGSGKKFIVRDVRLENLRVHTDVLPELGATGKVAVTIPLVHLTNVGSAEGGASVAELVGALVEAVLAATVEAGGGVLPKNLLGDLSGSLSKLRGSGLEQLGKQIGSGLEGLGKALDKLFK